MTASSLRSSVAVRPRRSSYCGSIARRSVLPPRPWHSSAISNPPPAPGGTGLYAAAEWRVATRTSQSAGPSRPLSPSRPMRAVGECQREPAVPLLHEDARRNEHQHEAAPAQRVRGRGDRDIGLARTGDRFDDTPAPAAQPAHEGVELPTVELTISRARTCRHGRNNGTGPRRSLRPRGSPTRSRANEREKPRPLVNGTFGRVCQSGEE